MSHQPENRPDKSTVVISLLAIIGLSLFLASEFNIRHASLFLVGIGLGISLLHAAFGFSFAWRQFIRERRSQGVRAQLILFIIATVLFFPLFAKLVPELRVAGAISPAGVSVLAGAFLFGIGMQLGNGCGSGTLFTVGGGHVNMLVTLLFFMIGSVIGTVHFGWWAAQPSLGKVSLGAELGWLPAAVLQVALLLGLLLLVRYLDRRRHGELVPLVTVAKGSFAKRLIFGPWSLVWGIAGLALFSLLTLVLAGHPWSITFAFGLWGAKILSAVGVDVAAIPYWSSGYAARALNASVLADVTSIMNFGIVLGAVLASALAGRFAPAKKLDRKLIMTAIIGGLLLGYGARLAYGCNIGGLFSGIASGSLHGWVWLVSGFLGCIAGMYIRIWTGIDKPLTRQA